MEMSYTYEYWADNLDCSDVHHWMAGIDAYGVNFCDVFEGLVWC